MQSVPMKTTIDLSLVVVMARNRIIGRSNDFSWRLPNDPSLSESIVRNSRTMVMGYNTYRSLLASDGGLSPDRHYIVLTREHSFAPTDLLQSVASLGEAIVAIMDRGGHACVIGGGEIFKLFLQYITRAYITTVDAELGGDIYFPVFPPKEMAGWERVLGPSDFRIWGSDDTFRSSFSMYERRCLQ